jgi:hypothetical protein
VPIHGVVELPAECGDGADSDGDGAIDLDDTGCSDPTDPSENDPVIACDDGVDNDGDGFADFPQDPGCADATRPHEDPACQDGRDNDGDGKIDFDGGASAGVPPALPDPHCPHARVNASERRVVCGAGAELAPILALLAALRRRARSR